MCVFLGVLYFLMCSEVSLSDALLLLLSPSSGCVVSCVCMSALVATPLHCLPLFVCCRVCALYSIWCCCDFFLLLSPLTVTFHLSRVPLRSSFAKTCTVLALHHCIIYSLKRDADAFRGFGEQSLRGLVFLCFILFVYLNKAGFFFLLELPSSLGSTDQCFITASR